MWPVSSVMVRPSVRASHISTHGVTCRFVQKLHAEEESCGIATPFKSWLPLKPEVPPDPDDQDQPEACQTRLQHLGVLSAVIDPAAIILNEGWTPPRLQI
jgi:hypothetical protein